MKADIQNYEMLFFQVDATSFTDLPITSMKTIRSTNIVRHRLHGTKPSIPLDKVRLIQEHYSLSHKTRDLGFARWMMGVKRGTSKLCNPDGLVEHGVHLVDILLEMVDIKTVVVNHNDINVSFCHPTKLLEKVLEPGKTVRAIGDGGRTQRQIAVLFLQRQDVLSPELDASVDAHVGLARHVRFVEADKVMEMSSSVQGIEELIDLADFLSGADLRNVFESCRAALGLPHLPVVKPG